MNIVYLILSCAASSIAVLGALWAIGRHLVDTRLASHGFAPAPELRAIRQHTAQLEPNHGTHLADDVKAIRNMVLQIRREQRDVRADLTRQTEKMDTMQSQLDRLDGAFGEYTRRH